ncbi:hypothetical protein G3260_000491 [Streptomyces albus]|nr:hypothetical protein [Streptomyces albus]QID40618.1 hypothetical protein G3260_000491 [Streptomyces albus]
MGRLRTLLHWRSLHWKIASLVAVACTAVALTETPRDPVARRSRFRSPA